MTKDTLILLYLFTLGICSCRQPEIPYVTISGPAMGTRYNITLACKEAKRLQVEIENLLDNYNLSLSTYIPVSRITKFNDSKDSIAIDLQEDSTFLPVLELSEKIYQLTDGAFDPTVMPLLEFYGFGNSPSDQVNIDYSRLDSIRSFVGFDLISWYTSGDQLIIKKEKPGVMLNFNSIAKGYGVDLVAAYLDCHGIKDYLVEIGGEVHVQGQSPRKKDWVVGINTPDSQAGLQDYELPVSLHNKAMATSGNYRNFYEVKGKKYVHIIDPKTGENRESDIASASVVAEDCATADALATAAIVMGKEKTLRLFNTLNQISACLIVYHKDEFQTIFTDNFENQ